MDIFSYLSSKNIQLKEVGNGQAYTHCFYCDENPSKRGRLYFNVEEGSERYGLHHCFLCGKRGSYNSLLQFFGDESTGSDRSRRSYIFDAAARYYHERLFEHPEVYEYLTGKRGLSDETIERSQLGFADGGLVTELINLGFDVDEIREAGLVNRVNNDFLNDMITIPYTEMGEVVSIRGKVQGGKYMSLPGSTARLYGVDAIRGEKDVVVTAGEFDTLVLQQLGYYAVGVPGENIWRQEWMKEFDDAGRVYILYDSDDAGRAGAEKAAAKFGPRARVASFPQEDLDVSKWYVDLNKTVEDFDMLFVKAKGGMLVSVHDAYERWTEVEGNPELVGLRFNIDEIDGRMNHGLLPGQVTTLLAKTNAGKTIMTINILYRMLLAQQDLQILYVSLEQTRNEWFERAHRIHNFYNPGATVIDTMDFWDSNFLMIDKNRLSSDELEVCVDQYAFERGTYPDILAIDYLGYFARSYKGEEYTRITNAIMDGKAIAKERQLKLIIPHQVNRAGNFGEEFTADQGRGSGAVEETSDLMLGLWAADQQKDVSETPTWDLHMKIMKSRDGGVNTKLVMQFCPLTLAVIPRSDPLYSRAVRERQYAIAGDDWKAAVYRYQTGDESV